jgi:hypothetical protein
MVAPQKEVVLKAPAPTAPPGSATREHQDKVFNYAKESLQYVLDRSFEDLEAAMESISPALSSEHAELESTEDQTGKADLVARLTKGRRYSSKGRRDLETSALLRSFLRRRDLLEGSLTAPKVAAVLGVSRQTPHDRAKSGTLLAVQDRGVLLFPSWQFDPEGPNGVVPGLPEVLQALHVSPISKASWLVRPNEYLGERTPLDALKAGERELVTALAESVGMS